jgi:hypothetical protein
MCNCVCDCSGRVYLRKGKISDAESRLREALGLYIAAYGYQRAGLHVNVAAVRHQLGQVALRQQRFDVAAEEFTFALSAKRRVYGQHLKVALELESLARVELERGDGGSCEADRSYLDQGLHMLKRLIQQETSEHISPSETLSNQHLDRLHKALLSCLFLQRSIAKKIGDVGFVTIVSREINLIKKEHPSNSKIITDSPESIANINVISASEFSSNCGATQLVIHARLLIRNLLKSNRRDSTDLYSHTLLSINEIIALLSRTQELLFLSEELNTDNVIFTFTFNVFRLFDIITNSSQIHPALVESKKLLFGHCDQLREKLQSLGIACVDN